MSTQPVTQQVQWQDLKVKNEIDIILEIAHQEGWDDCEIFGYGNMITEPQESMGWELIPADLYEYSIPAEGVGRLHQVINAGVRIQGVIIADDERGTEHSPTPTKPEFSLPSVETIVSYIGKALLGIICAAGAIALLLVMAVSLIYLAPILILGSILGTGAGAGAKVDFDPKLVILVDDGNGNMVWVSLFTWYD